MRRYALATLVVAATAAPAVADNVVSIDTTLAGTSGPTGGVTGDPDVATTAGPVDVLDVVTGEVAIRDRFGISPPVQMTTDQFWTAAGITGTPNAFEHRAVFDIASQRFFVTADELVAGANRRYLAVSDGSAAGGSWHAVALPADGVVTDTRVAVDANGVYVTGNGSDGATHVVAIPLADALATPPTLAHATALSIPELDVIPAIDAQGGKQPTDPEVLAGRGVAQGGDTTLRTYLVTWPGGGAPATLATSSQVDLNAVFSPPPATASQGSGAPLLAVGGAGLRSLTSAGSQLYGLAATQVGGHAAAFWFQVDLALGAVVRDTISVPQGDLLVPALAVDTFGDIGVIGVEVMQGDMFPVIAGRAADFSQTAVMSALQTYGGAAGTYSCNPDGGVTSFGRYASLGVDPTSGELFGDAPYVSDGTACAFQTSLVGFYVQDARFADDFPDDGGVAIGGGGGGFPTGDDVPDGGGCGCSTAAPRDAAAPLLVIALGALVSRSRGRARRRADRSR